MRQYQYLMNTLLLIVKSKQLMKVQDIMRMFNANYAIDSWFKIIIKEHDFNYISKHMRCMAYQILIEILRIDAKITREKIMSWTYNIDKTDKLINRIDTLIQIITNLLNKNVKGNKNSKKNK